MLGNPVGLVGNLGTGVADFFYEPAQGLVKSPKDFSVGLAKVRGI
jgi:vacuolar protein sorting-associated protein 13A/C